MPYSLDAVVEEIGIEAWKEIKNQVEQNGGVATVAMEKLRNAHGSAKSGKHVRTEISKQLNEIGLGHIPEQLPAYQDELVRLYKRGTPVGNLIDTVLKPGTQNDHNLQNVVGSPATRRKLRRPVVQAKANED